MSSENTDNTPVYVSGRKTPPFAQAAHWVLVADGISPSAKALYTVLCGLLAKGERDTFASREALAGILGCSDRSVWNWTKELEKINAITVEVHKNRDGRANVYHVHELPPPGYEGVMSLWAKRDEVVSGIAVRKKAKTKDGESPSSPGVRQNLPDPNQNGETEGGPAIFAGGVRQYLPEGSGNICRPPNNGVQEPSKTPPVVDERSVREPAVRTDEDPIDEAPDFMRDADRVAVEEVIAASAAENPPTVETTQGGDKNNENQNPNRTIAGELLREAFAGVNTGDPDSADVKRKKLDLVDELTRKLDSGVPKRDVRERLGGLASTQAPIGVALYRVRNLTSLTGPSQPSSAPRWCGECDESTRMAETAESIPYRCPNCNPLAGEPRVSRSNGAEDALYRTRGIEAQRAHSRRIRDDLKARRDERKAAEARLEAQKEARKSRESLPTES